MGSLLPIIDRSTEGKENVAPISSSRYVGSVSLQMSSRGPVTGIKSSVGVSSCNEGSRISRSSAIAGVAEAKNLPAPAGRFFASGDGTASK